MSEEIKENINEENDNLNPEDEKAYDLISEILNIVEETLNKPEVSKIFKLVTKSTNEELTVALSQIIGISMITSITNSIMIYDKLSKEEISQQLDILVKQINNNTADIQGMMSAIQVLKKRIDDLKLDITIDKNKI